MISLSTYENPTPNLIGWERIKLLGQEPVTLQATKNYLRISHSKDDEMIGMLLKASRESLETQTNRSYVDGVILAIWDSVSIHIDFSNRFSQKNALEVEVSCDHGESYECVEKQDYTLSNEVFTYFGANHGRTAKRFRIKYAESVKVPELAKILIMRLTRWHYDNKAESVGQNPDWLQKESAKLSLRTWF